MSRSFTAMSHRASLLARLIAMHVVLFGAAAANPASAQDTAPASKQTDALPHGPGGGQQQGANGDTGSATSLGSIDAHVSGNGDAAAKGDPGTKDSADTKYHEKFDAKGSSGEGTPGECHTNSKGEEDAKGAPHGNDHSAGKHAGFGADPIDTSITVQGPPKSRHPTWAHDWRKAKVAKLPGEFRSHHLTSTTGKKDVITRNAIGMPIQKREVRKEPDARVFTPPTIDDTAKNAAGPAGTGGVGAVGPDLRRQGLGQLPSTGGRSHDPPINTAMNPSIINGTGMMRPGLGNGSIGGAPKSSVGVINGTSFRPRHL
jgi:hypothetical protein